MIEIHCTAENVREEVSDLFPDPSEDEQRQIERAVIKTGFGYTKHFIRSREGTVIVRVVPESPTTERGF